MPVSNVTSNPVSGVPFWLASALSPCPSPARGRGEKLSPRQGKERHPLSPPGQKRQHMVAPGGSSLTLAKRSRSDALPSCRSQLPRGRGLLSFCHACELATPASGRGPPQPSPSRWLERSRSVPSYSPLPACGRGHGPNNVPRRSLPPLSPRAGKGTVRMMFHVEACLPSPACGRGVGGEGKKTADDDGPLFGHRHRASQTIQPGCSSVSQLIEDTSIWGHFQSGWTVRTAGGNQRRRV